MMVNPVLLYRMHLVPLCRSDQCQLDSWFRTRIRLILGIRSEQKITNQEVRQWATATLGQSYALHQPNFVSSVCMCVFGHCLWLTMMVLHMMQCSTFQKVQKTSWQTLHKVVTGCHPKEHPPARIPKTTAGEEAFM